MSSRRAGTLVAALIAVLLLGALSSAALAQEPPAAPATTTTEAQTDQTVDPGSEGKEATARSGAKADADEAELSGDARNCDDFATQEEAQEYFTANGGSDTTNVDNLDADGDGVACETGEQAGAPSGAADGAPTSGPHSGGGGTATQPGDSPLGFILGGAGIGLVLATVALMRRRRPVT